jgi:energy-coupling factor transporter transmembrane protein EcfT
MTEDTNVQFARITPVDRQQAGKVLNPWNLIWYNLLVFGFLVTFGVGWCFLLAVTGFLLGVFFGASAMASAIFATLLVLVGYLCLLFLCFGFAYPEWPLNRVFCRQFLRSVALREDPVLTPLDPLIRVVELVPRNRWQKKFCLDTATDLMLIRVDERGVWMQGDRYRYELPAESILGAELESTRPPGSYPMFRVILYVRTEAGPIDLPISYRDHSWGSLRSSRRRAQAEALAEQINGIARGQLYRPLQSPIVDDLSRTASWSGNPYAAPASI